MVAAGSFEEAIRAVLGAESSAITRRIAKRSSVYAAGIRDDKVYLIAAGQIKVVTQSRAGKECLLAVYTAGELFGENCLATPLRSEAAIAMSDSVLRQVTGTRFLNLMMETGLVRDFVRYLALRLCEQQQTITNLATADCEYRLAAILLYLSRKSGDRESPGLAGKISHQELSQMVGTTRPRVSGFMQRFRDLGLVDLTPDSRILVRETLLQEYLETRRIAPHVQAAAC